MKITRLALAFLLFAGAAHAADTSTAAPQSAAAPAAATPAAQSKALVGTWDREENVPNTGLVDAQMTFEEGGNFHGQVQVQEHIIWTFAGKWQVQDGAIVYDYTESSRADIPVGTKDKDRIISITPDKLTIQSETGEEVYVRKGSKDDEDLYIGPR